MNKNEFIDKIKEIEGMDDSKVHALYDAGYTSIEKLEEASIGELAKIEGISRRVAKSLLHSLFPEKFESTEEQDEERESEEDEKTPSDESDDEEIVEEKELLPKVSKLKPVLSDEEKRLLSIRKQRKDGQPTFLRQEWFRYPRLGLTWRKPRGLQSKMRKNLKYRSSMVRAGFGNPDEVRGRHPSGFIEVMVHNVNDLGAINPEKEAARIAGSVGSRKRKDIISTADERGIRILNRGL